jgi:hypothetical protein
MQRLWKTIIKNILTERQTITKMVSICIGQGIHDGKRKSL